MGPGPVGDDGIAPVRASSDRPADSRIASQARAIVAGLSLRSTDASAYAIVSSVRPWAARARTP